MRHHYLVVTFIRPKPDHCLGRLLFGQPPLNRPFTFWLSPFGLQRRLDYPNWTTRPFGLSKFGLHPKLTTPSFRVHPFRLSPTQPLSWSGHRRVCQQMASIYYTSPPTAYTEVEKLMFRKSQTLLSNTSQNKIIWDECKTGSQQSYRSISLFRSWVI